MQKLNNKSRSCRYPLYIILISAFLFSCKKVQRGEQIHTNNSSFSIDKDSVLRSIQGNITFNQLNTTPNSVILTGLPDHRLVPVYLFKETENTTRNNNSRSTISMDYDGSEGAKIRHYMPGFDLLFGFYLLNIAHYDMKTAKLNFFFNHSALIKTLYYPSFIQDSINKKPINRDFYLVSVYDEDTNKDSLINRKDLRRFYLFDINSGVKTQLIPGDYNVERSQYDSQNDVMYIFARQDVNKNGTGDKHEPVHVFWINLKAPQAGKLLY